MGETPPSCGLRGERGERPKVTAVPSIRAASARCLGAQSALEQHGCEACGPTVNRYCVGAVTRREPADPGPTVLFEGQLCTCLRAVFSV